MGVFFGAMGVCFGDNRLLEKKGALCPMGYFLKQLGYRNNEPSEQWAVPVSPVEIVKTTLDRFREDSVINSSSKANYQMGSVAKHFVTV